MTDASMWKATISGLNASATDLSAAGWTRLTGDTDTGQSTTKALILQNGLVRVILDRNVTSATGGMRVLFFNGSTWSTELKSGGLASVASDNFDVHRVTRNDRHVAEVELQYRDSGLSLNVRARIAIHAGEPAVRFYLTEDAGIDWTLATSANVTFFEHVPEGTSRAFDSLGNAATFSGTSGADWLTMRNLTNDTEIVWCKTENANHSLIAQSSLQGWAPTDPLLPPLWYHIGFIERAYGAGDGGGANVGNGDGHLREAEDNFTAVAGTWATATAVTGASNSAVVRNSDFFTVASESDDFEANALGTSPPAGWTARDASSTESATWTVRDDAGDKVVRVIGSSNTTVHAALTNNALGSSVTNIETQIRFKPAGDGLADRGQGVILRGGGTADTDMTGYSFQLETQGTERIKVKRISGTSSRVDLGSSTKLDASTVAGAYWNIKAVSSGTALRMKVWADADPEPSSWDIDVTDATHASGFVGLFTEVLPGTEQNNWSNFTSTTPGSAEVSWAMDALAIGDYYVGVRAQATGGGGFLEVSLDGTASASPVAIPETAFSLQEAQLLYGPFTVASAGNKTIKATVSTLGGMESLDIDHLCLYAFEAATGTTPFPKNLADSLLLRVTPLN